MITEAFCCRFNNIQYIHRVSIYLVAFNVVLLLRCNMGKSLRVVTWVSCHKEVTPMESIETIRPVEILFILHAIHLLDCVS